MESYLSRMDRADFIRYVFRAEQIGCYSDAGYLEIEDDEE